MSKKNTYKGKDVDTAINMACDDFGVSLEQLTIEIVSPGSKGIFGLGRKKAVIKASKKESSDTSKQCQPKKNTVAKNKPKTTHKKVSPTQHKKQSNKIESLMGRVNENLNATPPSSETVEEVKSLLLKMVELMGFPSEVTATVNGNKISAHIAGEHSKSLIGRNGDTLDAIQYLMRKMISQKKYPDKLFFSLDCGNFRESRKKELQELAIEMANQVKETGKTRTIAALNPAERRIVHVTLQDDKSIRSSSVGEGLYKKIRIFIPGKGRKRSGRRPRSNKNRSQSSAAEVTS